MRKKQLEAEFLCLDSDYQKLLTENIRLKELLSLANDEVVELKEKIKLSFNSEENARKLKHDMRNHLMVITMLMADDKIDEAKEYTSNMLGKLNLNYSYVKSGNTLLNYILNAKISEAQKSSVDIKLQIEELFFYNMESFDFSAMLSNALDNAISAAVSSQKKKLSLIIKEKGGYNTVFVANSIDKSVLKENPELNTTKDDEKSHGIGTSQIKSIVNKYGGLVDIFENDGMFCMNIMIPIV